MRGMAAGEMDASAGACDSYASGTGAKRLVPYGAMAIGVNTRHLLAELDDHGGNIEIDYCIEVDHAVASRNIFCIQFKEAEGSGSLKQ